MWARFFVYGNLRSHPLLPGSSPFGVHPSPCLNFEQKVRMESNHAVMHKMLSVTTLRGPLILYGTSPFWEPVTESLIYADSQGKSIIRYIPRMNNYEVMNLEQQVGFVVPTTQASKTSIRLFAGLEDRIVEIDIVLKVIIRTIVRIPDDLKTNGRFNGGRCSPNGILFVTYIQLSVSKGPCERLFKLQIPSRIGMNGTLDLVMGPHDIFMSDLRKIESPHGLAWMDNQLFVVESGTMSSSIVCYRVHGVDVDGGNSLVERMGTVFSLPSADVLSGQTLDGLAIDGDGKLWTCVAGGRDVNGGKNLEFLFVSTRSDGGRASGLVYLVHSPGAEFDPAKPVPTRKPTGLGHEVPVFIPSLSGVVSPIKSTEDERRLEQMRKETEEPPEWPWLEYLADETPPASSSSSSSVGVLSDVQSAVAGAADVVAQFLSGVFGYGETKADTDPDADGKAGSSGTISGVPPSEDSSH